MQAMSGVYDAQTALLNIDQHAVTIMACLLLIAGFAFAYFAVAIRMAIRQQAYVVPLVGAALFFWHDLNFVLMYEQWFEVYNHWWLKMWWYALAATVALEAFLIFQVIRYGHRELWPALSKPAYTTLVLLATLGIGGLWWLVKSALGDPLFFISFAITAVWSVPFHTAIMIRRRSRVGQSVFMQASTIAMLLLMTLAFAQIDAFFYSPPFLAFVASFIAWALVNIVLIRKLPER